MNSIFRARITAAIAVFFAASAFAADTPSKIFDVRKYGAKGDGTTLDTAAIQKAIDDAGKADGGVVSFPAGTYLSQPIHLRSKVTLDLQEGATLQARDERSDFADPTKPDATNAFIAFINGRRLNDVAITGKGVIDGAGAKWWVPAEAARRVTPGYTLPRPKMIVITDSKNVQMSGVTLQNSPCFHFVPTRCENVLITGITIKAPADSPNTDGIDPSACKRVVIAGCMIDVGDDNVAIKAGTAGSPCEDITVTNCTFLHGHGMSIGSESVGGVRRLLVKDCTFKDTDNGLRIKSRRGRGGVVEDLVYTDIKMENVNPAISIACYYQDLTHSKFPKDDPAQSVTRETPMFRNITISNVTATCTRDAGMIVGLPESFVKSVKLVNVQITAPEGLTIGNARDIQLKNVKITTKTGPPFVRINAEVTELDAK